MQKHALGTGHTTKPCEGSQRLMIVERNSRVSHKVILKSLSKLSAAIDRYSLPMPILVKDRAAMAWSVLDTLHLVHARALAPLLLYLTKICIR